MTALIIILLLLGALTLTPLGARACYTGNVFYLDLRVGHFYKRLLPKKKTEGKAKKPKKAKKKKEKKPKEEEGAASEKPKKQKKPISFFIKLAKMGLHASRIFLRSIVIDRLNVRITFAGPDPAAVALDYGKASSIAESIQGIAQRLFRVKRYDVQLNADFCADKLLAEGEIEISFMLWSLFGMANCFAFAFIKMMISDKLASLREKRALKKQQQLSIKQHGGNYERV